MPVNAAQQRRRGFYLKTDIAVGDGELQKLPVRNPALAAERCAELAPPVASALGVPSLALTPWPDQGTFHLVHGAALPDGRKIVIRSSLPEIFSHDSGFLVDDWALRQLPRHGLPGLPVLHVDCSRSILPYEWMIMAQAPGTVMTALPETVLEDPATFQAVGAALHRLHDRQGDQGYGAVDTEKLERGEGLAGMHGHWQDHALCLWEDHLEKACAAAMLTESESKTLRDFAAGLTPDWAQCPSSLLHGDPGNSNFALQDGQVCAILDWEDALIGDPLYDVAFWATFHPQRRWAGFWRGYGMAPRAGESGGLRFAFYFLRITLAKVLHRRRFGYPDLPGRPTLRRRVEQALALVQGAQGKGAQPWLGAAA